MVETYWHQLEELADEHDVCLLKACIQSDVGDYLFYRMVNKKQADIHRTTAIQIENAILILSRKPARKHIGNGYAELIDMLIRRRRRLEISQLQLDQLIGCADGLVSKWECGDRVPKPTSLLEWCQALKVGLTLRKAQ